MKPVLRNLLIGLGVSLLVACGGGGGGGDDTPPANPPSAQASTTQNTVTMGDTVNLSGTGSSAGTGGGTLTYKWALASRPANSTAALSDASAAQPSFVADKPGTYTVDLIVNDGQADSSPSRVTINATSPYPVANTAPTISVQLGTETVGLDGSASTPPTGASGALSYHWSLQAQPAGSAGTIRDWDKGNATLVVDLEGDYLLQLVVSYDGVDSEPAHVTVTVSKGDAPPVAVAEAVTVKLGDTVTLDGSQSYDPDGQLLQYRWRFRAPTGSQTGAPIYVPTPTLNGATTAKPSFVPQAVGEYNIDFFVFDGVWKSETLTVTVIVEKPAEGAANLPLVGKLTATGYYPSSSVGEQELGLRADFSFEGYDPEGEAVQFVSAEIVSKPSGSEAVLEERFPGFGLPYLRKIQKLDVVGDYKVRMTVSDGVNQGVYEATMRARIGGINNRPVAGGIAPIAASALVGNPIIFEAGSSVRDPDGDRMTYHWTLFDRPDGSRATVEPMIEPESGQYRRARVTADVPGVYIVRLEVEDDRGLRSSSYSETQAMAKTTNNPPVIRRVAFATQYTQLRDGELYQLLPCMRLTFAPVVVDPDGDQLYTHRELISAPEGGRYGQNQRYGCSNNDQTFNAPGEYVFRYITSDGIAETPAFDFKVVIEPMAQARGVLLEDVFETTTDPIYTLQAWPYTYVVPTNFGGGSSRPATAPETMKKIRLTAVDGDYTITDLKLQHLNGTTLTPYFDGITEGQVIPKGQSVVVSLMNPPFGCLRSEESIWEGFHWEFRVKEIPQATFVHEFWRSAILNGGATPWPLCSAN